VKPGLQEQIPVDEQLEAIDPVNEHWQSICS